MAERKSSDFVLDRDDLSRSLEPPALFSSSSYRSFPQAEHVPASAVPVASSPFFSSPSDDVYRSFSFAQDNGLEADSVRSLEPVAMRGGFPGFHAEPVHMGHDMGLPGLDDLRPVSLSAQAEFDYGPSKPRQQQAQGQTQQGPLNAKFASLSFDDFGAKNKAGAPILTAIEVPRAEPPSVPGGYLEPAYHFHTTANPVVVLKSVHSVLESAQVECQIKAEKYKIKGTSFKAGVRVPFTVRVFTVDANANAKRYAVEFQRRSGCVIHFNELFRTAKRALYAKNLIEKTKSSVIPAEPAGLPPLDCVVTPENAKETMKSLVSMAQSQFIDVKSQAVLALADLSNAGGVVQQSMIKDGALDCLIDELSCKFEDVHRGALTAVANLSQNDQQVCTRIRDAGAVKTLFTLSNSHTMHVVREAARTIHNVGNTLGKGVIDDDFKRALHVLGCSRDPDARKYAVELTEALAH